MYCVNCGEKLIEQAVSCPSCGIEIKREQPIVTGAPIEPEFIDTQTPYSSPYVSNQSRLLSDQSKKMILVAMAAAALIFLILKFTGGAGSQGTPEKTVKGFMNAVMKENAQEMVSYLSSGSTVLPEGEKRNSFIDSLETRFEEGELGLSDYSILKVDQNEDIAKVDYEVVYMSEDEEKRTDEEFFELKKIDGKWYIDDGIFGF